MSHSSIFPIQDESFKRDALDFFSFVSQDQIAKYMDDFKQRKLLFSTAHFSRISGTGIWQARKSRLTFLGLIQIIRIRKADREASVGELVSLGCEKAKVSAFVDRALALDEDTVSAGRFILRVSGYVDGIRHLSDFRAEWNYTSFDPIRDEKSFVLFPLATVILRSHLGNETQEVEFSMDIDDLEVFSLRLQETLQLIARENRVLKKSLGDRFTELIGE